MEDYGYGKVSSVAFGAFEPMLDEAPFKDAADKKTPGLKTPSLALLYVMLLHALRELAKAEDPSVPNPSDFDGPFDQAQRYLRDGIAAELNNPDAKKAHAAKILFSNLLQGKSGLGQSKLSLADEVAFGRWQSQRAGEEPYKSHIKTLGLEARVKAAHDKTEALAQGIGANPDAANLLPRYARLALALQLTRDTFQTVHASLILARPHADDALGATIDRWLDALNSIPRER